MYLLTVLLGLFCVSAHASSLNTKYDEKVMVNRLSTHYDRVRRSILCAFPFLLPFEFHVNEVKITLLLEKNLYVISEVPVYTPGEANTVLKSKINDKQNFALYHDRSRGSAMLVSCEGDSHYKLEGSFKYQGITYHMTPSNEPEVTNAHYLRRHHEEKIEFDRIPGETEEFKAKRPSKENNRRKKREVPTGNVVEILFSVDYPTYEIYLSDEGTDNAALMAIKKHVLMLTNELDIYYAGIPSVNPDVDIRVCAVGVWINNNTSVDDWSTLSTETVGGEQYLVSGKVLDEVTKWRGSQNGLPSHDHVMALSLTDFVYIDTSTSEVYKSITGKAKVCVVCKSPSNSVSFTELGFNGRTAQTMAHELGHALCAGHDETDDCSADQNNVMTPVFWTTINSTYATAQWTFSTCSVEEFKGLLDSLDSSSNCMLKHTFNYDEKVHDLPGQVYSPDDQCTMYQGYDSYPCNDLSETSCHSGFHCFNETGGCTGVYYPLYPLTGTQCKDTDKICHKGVCVPRASVITTTSTSSSTTSSTTSTTSSTTSSTSPTSSSTTSSTSQITSSTTSTTSRTSPTSSSTTSSTSPTTSSTTSTTSRTTPTSSSTTSSTTSTTSRTTPTSSSTTSSTSPTTSRTTPTSSSTTSSTTSTTSRTTPTSSRTTSSTSPTTSRTTSTTSSTTSSTSPTTPSTSHTSSNTSPTTSLTSPTTSSTTSTTEACSNERCCIIKRGRRRCCRKNKCCKRKFRNTECSDFCCQ